MILSGEYEDFILDYVKHLHEARPGINHMSHLAKVLEELGEAAQALLLHKSLNPRKDEVRVSAHDVAMEYADVIMTACVALVALGFGPDQILEEQLKKTQSRVWW